MFTEKELRVIDQLLTLALQNRKLRNNPDQVSDETAEIANEIIRKIEWPEVYSNTPA